MAIYNALSGGGNAPQRQPQYQQQPQQFNPQQQQQQQQLPGGVPPNYLQQQQAAQLKMQQAKAAAMAQMQGQSLATMNPHALNGAAAGNGNPPPPPNAGPGGAPPQFTSPVGGTMGQHLTMFPGQPQAMQQPGAVYQLQQPPGGMQPAMRPGMPPQPLIGHVGGGNVGPMNPAGMMPPGGALRRQSMGTQISTPGGPVAVGATPGRSSIHPGMCVMRLINYADGMTRRPEVFSFFLFFFFLLNNLISFPNNFSSSSSFHSGKLHRLLEELCFRLFRTQRSDEVCAVELTLRRK